jgi:hypothetical protein
LLRFAPCHAGKSIGFLKCLTACNTTVALSGTDGTAGFGLAGIADEEQVAAL